MTYKQDMGQYGEDLAVRYLISKKYTIIARNIKSRHKEIDIVALFEAKIIFVEVKTRTNKKYGSADESMTARKICNLKNAIINYCIKFNQSLDNVRLDLIAIDIDKINKKANIKHYISIL